jgi:uncharacterized Zn-binding protein involved in type VI secretion
MPGFLLHVGATAICPHGGQVSIISTNTRVLVGGQPVATLADTYLVAGCAFTVPGPKPQPCVKVQWLAPAVRVLVGGQPAILQTSAGLCQSAEQIPQGPPSVIVTQVRVRGT